jgi:tyrosyl-tRNA synthetase
MFGKLMSIPDELVPDYARLLTDLPTETMEEIDDAVGSGGESIKTEKKTVAHEIVRRLKGEDSAEEARNYFERTIEEDETPDEDEVETFTVEGTDVWIVDLLDESGLVESRSEAKRLLKQGGVYLDEDQLEGFDHDVPMDEPVLLRVGKHRYRRAVPKED